MPTGANVSLTSTTQRLIPPQTPVILSEAKNPRISLLPLHLLSPLHLSTRHPERSNLRTMQVAQSKDPDTAHLPKTARPILPTTPTALAIAVAPSVAVAPAIAVELAVALASGVGPGFSPDIQPHHKTGL